MQDQESSVSEQNERIVSLEAQVRDLQGKVKTIQAQRRRKTSDKKFSDLRATLSGELMKKILHVFVFMSVFPFSFWFAAMFFSFFGSSLPFPPWEMLNLFPGGESVWIPIWQFTMFLTFSVGAVVYVFSPD